MKQWTVPAVLAICSAMPAAAAEWGVGLGTLYAPNPYHDTDPTRMVIPVINYEGENFYLRGIKGGYRFIKDREQTLEAFVLGYLARFDPDDSGDLRLLDERKFAVMGGMGYSRNYQWGRLGLEAAYDISGHSDGTVVEFSYSYPVFAKDYRWMVTPQLGLTWFNDSYVDYYAGVSQVESARSGIEAYEGKATLNPYVALAGFYNVTPNWRVGAFLRGGWQGEGFADSPMMQRTFVPSGFVALTYQF